MALSGLEVMGPPVPDFQGGKVVVRGTKSQVYGTATLELGGDLNKQEAKLQFWVNTITVPGSRAERHSLAGVSTLL